MPALLPQVNAVCVIPSRKKSWPAAQEQQQQPSTNNGDYHVEKWRTQQPMMMAFVCHASGTASHKFRAGRGSNCCYSRPTKPRWSLLIDCEAVIGCYSGANALSSAVQWSREAAACSGSKPSVVVALPLVLCFALLLPRQLSYRAMAEHTITACASRLTWRQ